MTQQRDIERLLDLWFSDGPTECPDRVADVVADRIERQPQRPAWRFHLREIHVSNMLRAGIAVAAVVVVAFIAYELLPGQSSGVGGPGPSPSSIVTAPPSASPSPSASLDAAACATTGQGCPSPFPAGPVTSTVFKPRVSFTAPTGYIPFGESAQTFGVNTAAGSTPGGFFIFRDPAPSTQANACAGDQNLIGSLTVDSVTSAFAADTRFQVSTPAPVTIGPYTGKTFDLQLAPTWTGTCPWSSGKPAAMVLTVVGGPTPTSPSYGIASGDPPIRVYLLDVLGLPMWIQVDKSTADQVLPVLQTLTFTP